MNLVFRKSFTQDVRNVKNRKVLADVAHRITEIESAATLRNIRGLKKLAGAVDCYRIRVGHYRIGLVVHGAELELVRLLARRDLYRYFP